MPVWPAIVLVAAGMLLLRSGAPSTGASPPVDSVYDMRE